MLQAFYLSLGQPALLDALDIVKLNMQARETKCPTSSSLSQSSHHEDEMYDEEWCEIIRALEHLGITATLATSHREAVIKYFEGAIAAGELPCGAHPNDTDSRPSTMDADASLEVQDWLSSFGSQDSHASLQSPHERDRIETLFLDSSKCDSMPKRVLDLQSDAIVHLYLWKRSDIPPLPNKCT